MMKAAGTEVLSVGKGISLNFLSKSFLSVSSVLPVLEFSIAVTCD